MARPDTPQPLTLFEAVLPVAGLVALVALSFYLFGDGGALGPNQVALVVATMIAVFIAWRRGHTLASLRWLPIPPHVTCTGGGCPAPVEAADLPLFTNPRRARNRQTPTNVCTPRINGHRKANHLGGM